MGGVRFILAVMVLISHLSVSARGYNLGVMAVIVFYLLAGQVVVRLWASMREKPNAILVFARDRLLRILPQYYVAVGLSAGVWWMFGPASSFLPAHPGAWDWLANLTIFPLNYFMYTGLDSFMLIPPAWSLAAELQFYLLTPVLFSASAIRSRLIFYISFVVFLLAQLSILHTDYFGYRLLPGILFIFMLGAALAHSSPPHAQARYSLILVSLMWLAAVGYAMLLLLVADREPFRLEVAIGLAIGLPLIKILLQHPSKQRWLILLNRRAGELSFGLFLYHFPVIWVLQTAGQPYTGMAAIPAVLFLSTLLAAVGHWCIERPLWRVLRPRVIV